MPTEVVYPIEQDILDYFAQKGKEGGSSIPQVGNANGVKVRRIIQIIRDLSRRPFEELSILDCACGEGVYAIEAGLRGAHVRALDARTERMDHGRQYAERLELQNVTFEQADVRGVTASSHGEFDAILFLGILYHLDVPDSFKVLENLASMCRHLLIIDTQVAMEGVEEAEFKGRRYSGYRIREHEDDDSEEERRRKVLMSIDNTFAFHFTPASLVELLVDTGFTSVFECRAPLEPFKPGNRITVVAVKSEPVAVSTYPWVNGKSRDEIQSCLAGD
jgi:SAM-dependent methyltransferase